jgi:tripartite-type tricarboxylate transporter receptor subunit TctC
MTSKGLLIVLALALGSSGAMSQVYPTKPITVIVPYTAGGGTDLTIRMVEDAVSRRLGQQLVITNKPGAAGTIGHYQLTKAAPDGYTLAVVGVGSTATSPHERNVGYGLDDYVPVVQLNTVPYVLVAPPNSPFKGLKDVLDAARKNPPGYIKVGTTSPTSWLHLVIVMLEKKEGVKFTYVPHGSAGDIVISVMGGNLNLGNVDPPSAASKIASGDLRALGVLTERRQSDMPNVPTLKEQGIDIQGYYYNSVIAPKGTPENVIRTLDSAFKSALEDPELRQRAAKAGIQFDYLGPAETKKTIKAFYDQAGIAMRELGMAKR